MHILQMGPSGCSLRPTARLLRPIRDGASLVCVRLFTMPLAFYAPLCRHRELLERIMKRSPPWIWRFTIYLLVKIGTH
jgi:hypothetical protein